MHHRIHFAIDEDVIRYIVPLKREVGISLQVGNIIWVACYEIIQTDDFMTVCKKTVA